jgi:putative ABC transport system permease protein
VVETGSKLASLSYSDIYRPFTSDEYRGSAVIMPKEGYSSAEVSAELKETADRFNTSNKEGEKISTFRFPISHLQSVFDTDYEAEFTWADIIRKYLIIVLALLLVPSLNLSGMISRRMEGRLAEMGIRKSFGATRWGLLRQVLNENLILTVIGGMVGLLIAWMAVILFRSSLFNLFGRMLAAGDIPLVTGEMMFSPTIFVSAFLVCVVLNILSALIPAWLSLRKPIVESMNEKR